MANYEIDIHGKALHIMYTYIPAQQEKYPDTEPLRSHIEIDSIYVYHEETVQGVGIVSSKVDITNIMLECADDWLVEIESQIISKLED